MGNVKKINKKKTIKTLKKTGRPTATTRATGRIAKDGIREIFMKNPLDIGFTKLVNRKNRTLHKPSSQCAIMHVLPERKNKLRSTNRKARKCKRKIRVRMAKQTELKNRIMNKCRKRRYAKAAAGKRMTHVMQKKNRVKLTKMTLLKKPIKRLCQQYKKKATNMRKRKVARK